MCIYTVKRQKLKKNTKNSLRNTVKSSCRCFTTNAKSEHKQYKLMLFVNHFIETV